MTAPPDSRSSAERADDLDRIQFEMSEAVREALVTPVLGTELGNPAVTSPAGRGGIPGLA